MSRVDIACIPPPSIVRIFTMDVNLPDLSALQCTVLFAAVFGTTQSFLVLLLVCLCYIAYLIKIMLPGYVESRLRAIHGDTECGTVNRLDLIALAMSQLVVKAFSNVDA